MKNILVPIDFSPVTRQVEREAIALARALGARPVFLHVVQPPTVVTDYAGMTLEDTAELMLDARKWAGRLLIRLRAKLRAQQVNAGTILETGAAVPCIVAEARKLKASLIVIGSHGHTAFYDLLIGGTARGVLQRATCPVVVVPARKAGPRPGRR
jgi:nucleotide-binding universal stress UspA family protein